MDAVSVVPSVVSNTPPFKMRPGHTSRVLAPWTYVQRTARVLIRGHPLHGPQHESMSADPHFPVWHSVEERELDVTLPQ